ncbi:MAG: NAD(P)/FAD-dependent oxidoreductase [Candidatus Omnitrophota bacterium]|jgi:prolycopene isomerase
MGIGNKYDVIVVGAGIGGLVCGAYLAKSGLKILIIEQNDKAGGCCVSFKRKGFRFDAGAHILGSCNTHGVLFNILKKLGVEQKFARIDPVERFFFGDDEYIVPAELDEYIAYLQRVFPHEKANIDPFFAELVRISRNIKTSYAKYADLTYEDFLNKYFKDAKLKSVLSAQSGYLGITPKRCSAVAMCAMMASYLKDGAYYPIGGGSSLSDKLADRVKFFGGSLKFNTKAMKFIVDNNRITGITACDSKKNTHKFYGSAIVSNIDATYTLFNMMPSYLISDTVRNNINESELSPALSMIFLGLKLDRKLIEKKNGWYYPDYDINKNLDDFVYISSPSQYDESAAPCGATAVEAFQICNFSKISGGVEGKKYKEETEKKLLNRVMTIIPEIKDNVVVKDSATAGTIKKYTSNKNGVGYGWALTPGQFARNVAISDSLKKILYLVGHWTNPGCGILTVAISGYQISEKILHGSKNKISKG